MHTHSSLTTARRRTDALPREDQSFLKGSAAACFLGACVWAMLIVLL